LDKHCYTLLKAVFKHSRLFVKPEVQGCSAKKKVWECRFPKRGFATPFQRGVGTPFPNKKAE